jgi:hypothetical protein
VNKNAIREAIGLRDKIEGGLMVKIKVKAGQTST